MKKLWKTLLLLFFFIFALPALAGAEDHKTNPQKLTQTAPQGEQTIDEKRAREALQSYLPGIESVGKLTASLDNGMGNGVLSWSFVDEGQPLFPYGNIFTAPLVDHMFFRGLDWSLQDG